jgi:hypothetical protein
MAFLHAVRKLKTYGRVSVQTCKRGEKRKRGREKRGREKREERPYFTIKA